MTDFPYTNPLLDTIPDADIDTMDAQDAARRPGFTPLPRGKYTAFLTEWGAETVGLDVATPLAGQRRIRSTFETDLGGRTRKIYVDFTDFPAKFPATDDKPETFVREYRLAGQLLKATGHRGKPLSEALEAARTTAVVLEVGVKNDRNVVYAVHAAA